jgi:hypothetical protein
MDRGDYGMLFIIVDVIYITLLARPKEGANNVRH